MRPGRLRMAKARLCQDADSRRPRAAGAASAERPRETIIQAQIVALARSVGGRVWPLGTVRRGSHCPRCGTFVPPHYGTQQGEGLPDLYMVLPRQRPDGAGATREAVWWECKRPDVRVLRPEQVDFQQWCTVAGVTHGWGDLDAFLVFLVDRQLIRTENIPHDRRQERE